jgi:multidrug efflux pump subunit AcrA (membrane-fusion protein)
VVRNGQLTGVYIVDDDSRARFRLVRLGQTFGDAVAVISGLHPGTRLVSAPPPELANGFMVEPAS